MTKTIFDHFGHFDKSFRSSKSHFSNVRSLLNLFPRDSGSIASLENHGKICLNVLAVIIY